MSIDTLSGAAVAITGGGRGIGRAIALELARRGAKVSVGDLDPDFAERVALETSGEAFALDVRSRASFDAFLRETKRAFGRIDVLVNNAGIMPTGPFVDEPDAISDAQIDVNLRGVILGAKLALPEMLARRSGHIVNVASMAGRLAVPGLSVYCATKFAVVGLTDSLREEYRDTGVSFTTILPAKVTTELASGTDVAGRGVPTASPEEVARAVAESILDDEAEVTVPRYMRPLAALQGVAPRGLLETIRGRLDDRRILTRLDRAARAAYDARIADVARRRAGAEVER